MARRDIIHDAVRLALEKENWVITDDPLYVKVEGGRGLEIDIGAEKLLGAEKGGEKIAVEIKSFVSPSILNSFHEALGQYLDYRDALEENDIDREIFIALPEEIYNQIEVFPFLMRRILKYKLKLIVVDIETQIIVLWKR